MAKRDAVLAALREIPWFHGLADGDARALIAAGSAKFYVPGAKIYREGDDCDRLAILLRGALTVEREDSQGNALRVGVIRAGELAGEMGVFDPATRNATVIATVESTILEVARDKLLAMRAANPMLLVAIANVALNNAMTRMDGVNDRIERELRRSKAPKIVKLRPGQAHPATPAPAVDTAEQPRLKKLWAKLTRF